MERILALRRAALGVIRIVLENNLQFQICLMSQQSHSLETHETNCFRNFEDRLTFLGEQPPSFPSGLLKKSVSDLAEIFRRRQLAEADVTEVLQAVAFDLLEFFADEDFKCNFVMMARGTIW